MIPKSGYRFSEEIMLKGRASPSSRLPAIEPIVAFDEAAPAHGEEGDGAQERLGTADVVDCPIAAGRALGTGGARAPLALVAPHGAGGIIRRLREPLREHRRV